MIHLLIQDSGLTDNFIMPLVTAAAESGIPYKGFGIVSGENELSGLEDILDHPGDDYIIMGSCKLIRLITEATDISDLNSNLSIDQRSYGRAYLAKLKQGLFYNHDAFDQQTYRDYVPTLNAVSDFLKAKYVPKRTFNEDKFIKPTNDLKSFTAGILKEGTTIGEFIEENKCGVVDSSTTVLVSSVKVILNEARFIVLNGEIIASSMYRVNGVVTSNGEIPEYVTEEAAKIATQYQPAEVYTMDLCFNSFYDPSSVSVVEYNCFNCSGMYLAGTTKMFEKLRDHFSSTWVQKKPQIHYIVTNHPKTI